QVIASLLADLAQPDADLETVAAFFRRLARLFSDPSLRPSVSGCLLVNATAELASRDARLRPAAAAYRDRIRAAFTNALRRAAKAGDIGPDTVVPRARLLSATVMGIWLLVRIDATDASRLCKHIAREVVSWRD